jgi:hypothetical protein
MKKLVLALALLGFASTSYATTYTCYRYVNGEPTGTWISVTADSVSEAESKAYQRMKELGGQVDYAKCRL